MPKLAAAFVSSAVSLLCVPAFAAVAVYSDRASFSAAAGTVVIESFNSYVADTSFQTVPLDVGAFLLEGFGTQQDVFNLIDVSPHVAFNIDGTPNVQALTAPPDTGLRFAFKSAIVAWGAEFNSLQAPNAILRTQITAAGEVLTPPLLQNNGLSFYGLVSSTPFTEVAFFNANADFVDGFAIDNVTFAAAIPEPGSYALMFSGLAALALFCCRRKLVFDKQDSTFTATRLTRWRASCGGEA